LVKLQMEHLMQTPFPASLVADEPRVFNGLHCTLSIRRPVPGVVLVIFEGLDVGEFGDAPFRELAQDVGTGAPIEIFIDARKVPAASIEVSAEWAQWMTIHRGVIQRLNILCASRFVELTANFVQRFTQFGDRMRIYTEVAAFEEALRVAGGARFKAI
jgi:hypothetical protein